MKTITREITLFTAPELKERFPSSFARALEKYSDVQDNFWSEGIISDFLTIASLMGFEIQEKDISWSGFHSQGDGASFTGTATFAPDALEKVKEYAPQDTRLHGIAADCARYGKHRFACHLYRISHQYSHEFTVSIDDVWTLDAEGEREQYHVESQDEIVATCRSLMQWLYRQLGKEYEYRAGEECFLETADANEWLFTAQGNLETE